MFVAHGYGIRKLNQAYFAFYGGYQSGSPGEGGSDPIGPAVQAIRDQSATIFPLDRDDARDHDPRSTAGGGEE